MTDQRTYKITRFRADGPNEIVRTGLTLYEAQAHCERADTHGEGWFDGYGVENPTPDELREREESDARLLEGARRIERIIGSSDKP